jgi:anti-sigma-K factor RskA
VSAHRDEHLELAAGWLVGALSDADAREFETHLGSGCEICRREIERLAGAVVGLAASAPPARPSAAVRGRVLAIARDEAAGRASAGPPAAAPARVLRMPPRRAAFTWAWAAAAAFAIASLGGWWTSARLQREAVSLRERLATTEKQLAEERDLLAVIRSPDARQVELATTPDAAAALKARATFDPRTRTAVFVFQGLTPTPDHDFQLWALRGAQVASLGVIHTDESGAAIVKVEVAGDPASLDAFALSFEKKGGSSSDTAPQGPVVMVGKLGG